jgi:DNA-binding MarR family transcriptional regulator
MGADQDKLAKLREMVSKKNIKKLQSLRPKGVSRLLLLARRNFVTEIGALIEKSGFPVLPDSCLMLLPYIDLEGTRSTDIARRASMSKQAVTQVINVMEGMKLVERRQDPNDARATLISFTDFGAAYLMHMHGIINQVEDDIHNKIGAEQMAVFRSVLDFMAYKWPVSSEDPKTGS